MSSNQLKIHLAVVWALAGAAFISSTGQLVLDFDGIRAIFSDVQRGIHDETPNGPISNETESFQGSPEPSSNTAPIPELDPSKGGGDDSWARYYCARERW